MGFRRNPDCRQKLSLRKLDWRQNLAYDVAIIFGKMEKLYVEFLKLASSMRAAGLLGMRLAIFIIFVWIGGLKFFSYEANGIVPFVANSPFMSFFYTHKAPEYAAYKIPEGAKDVAKEEWHRSNNTYAFSYGLGLLIISIGTLVLLGAKFYALGLLGECLAIIMTLGTLSFLITTPEVWVPAIGGPDHGFPYLSGAGRLVIKDTAILAGALILLSDTATRLLARKGGTARLKA